jgi:hypothetical protein
MKSARARCKVIQYQARWKKKLLHEKMTVAAAAHLSLNLFAHQIKNFMLA